MDRDGIVAAVHSQMARAMYPLIRDTSAEAWRDAEAKVAQMAASEGAGGHDHRRVVAHGQ
ncbi:hypothetical protein GCM10017635_25040 [Paracoccus kondratievae]|uniref:Uncharacterized protein n=1 Tax=Paracoccus kondratievae TaxID=135740 RepID=A0AAD3P070_9RHOB|nr:hypothetical protein GCM10017635_25040 [Paracoccus kondratievae]